MSRSSIFYTACLLSVLELIQSNSTGSPGTSIVASTGVTTNSLTITTAVPTTSFSSLTTPVVTTAKTTKVTTTTAIPTTTTTTAKPTTTTTTTTTIALTTPQPCTITNSTLNQNCQFSFDILLCRCHDVELCQITLTENVMFPLFGQFKVDGKIKSNTTVQYFNELGLLTITNASSITRPRSSCVVPDTYEELSVYPYAVQGGCQLQTTGNFFLANKNKTVKPYRTRDPVPSCVEKIFDPSTVVRVSRKDFVTFTDTIFKVVENDTEATRSTQSTNQPTIILSICLAIVFALTIGAFICKPKQKSKRASY